MVDDSRRLRIDNGQTDGHDTQETSFLTAVTGFVEQLESSTTKLRDANGRCTALETENKVLKAARKHLKTKYERLQTEDEQVETQNEELRKNYQTLVSFSDLCQMALKYSDLRASTGEPVAIRKSLEGDPIHKLKTFSQLKNEVHQRSSGLEL